jgi:hypothetical protein
MLRLQFQHAMAFLPSGKPLRSPVFISQDLRVQVMHSPAAHLYADTWMEREVEGGPVTTWRRLNRQGWALILDRHLGNPALPTIRAALVRVFGAEAITEAEEFTRAA